MAEIEHFCDPSDKSHPKFANIADLDINLYSACNQLDGKAPELWKLGEAVKEVSPYIVFIYWFKISCKKYIDPFFLLFTQVMHQVRQIIKSPVGWGFEIYQLHLCREVRPYQGVFWVWYKTIWWSGYSLRDLGNMKYPFIDLKWFNDLKLVVKNGQLV